MLVPRSCLTPFWARSVAVSIEVAHPRHREGQGALVAALRRQVKVIVRADQQVESARVGGIRVEHVAVLVLVEDADAGGFFAREDRKSTRLNSSHLVISYAVFCLKKK